MFARFAFVATLALPMAAGAEVLSVGRSPFDYAVKKPAAPAPSAKRPSKLMRTAGYLFKHMDGHGPIKPLAPVDNSARRPDSLETGETLVWKLRW
jgi:hypothetical protein